MKIIFLPEAKHVELDIPSMEKPTGHEYKARCPSFVPSSRSARGGVGVGGSGHVDTTN